MARESTKQVLERYKAIIVADLKKQLNKPGSRLDASISARRFSNANVDGLAVEMLDYGVNVNQGRSAGKMPPIDKIKDWIVRKGIQPKNVSSARPSSLNSQAYLIARSIGRRGIRPHRFIDEVIDRIGTRLTLDIANAYLKDLNKALDTKS